jgi:hypothetical protein
MLIAWRDHASMGIRMFQSVDLMVQPRQVLLGSRPGTIWFSETSIVNSIFRWKFPKLTLI